MEVLATWLGRWDPRDGATSLRRPSSDRAVEAFAGLMVLLSVVLTYFVHPNWVWLTVFVGVNLAQQSFTGFCPAAIAIKKVFGLQTEKELVQG